MASRDSVARAIIVPRKTAQGLYSAAKMADAT
jgi:hypothetical protein